MITFNRRRDYEKIGLDVNGNRPHSRNTRNTGRRRRSVIGRQAQRWSEKEDRVDTPDYWSGQYNPAGNKCCVQKEVVIEELPAVRAGSGLKIEFNISIFKSDPNPYHFNV